MRSILSIIFLLAFSSINAQIVTISGVAPGSLGNKIEVYQTEDYISDRQSVIASTQVEMDSSFKLTFNLNEIERLTIKSNNNRGYLYVQPNGKYNVLFPDRNIYEPLKASGNEVEISFYDLDSTDINYKILRFQMWIDYFLSDTYHLRNDLASTDYVEAFDGFKTRVQKFYDQDSSSNSTFLKTHILFSIAALENINNVAERNRYEKHDFFIKYHPVEYNNNIYMEYIKNFYKKLTPQLSPETNEAFYQGVLHSSPIMIMNAMGGEYTLINRRIREIVMIQALAENFYTDEYPQTNIITVLDSVINHSLFKKNGIIAKNIKYRLINLVPGAIAPNFVLMADSLETKTLVGLKGKHVYLHFFDPNSSSNQKELQLIDEINKKYSKYVKVISIYKSDIELTEEAKIKLADIHWDIYPISYSNTIWSKYQVKTFPHYTFLDASGYVVSSPALAPTPNGEYKTIDQSFFQLKRAWEQQNNDGGELYDLNN